MALFALTVGSFAQYQGMQVAPMGWDPSGVPIVGGTTAKFNAQWSNTTGQNVYIWGLQSDLWFGGTVMPGGSLDNGAGNALGLPSGPGSNANDYLRNVADLGVNVMRSDGMMLLSKGSDHYANDPELNAKGPVWFPVPFKILPGQALYMYATATNGYQPWVGGEIIFNADVYIYYTTGSTGNATIPNF